MKQRVFVSVPPTVVALLALLSAACGDHGAFTAPATPAAPIVMHAIGTDPVSGATIETNLDDYVPGEVVHVVGRGWSPHETVRLHMTENPDRHPDVSADVQADSSGAFTIHFYDVQPHDWGVTFTLVATGLTSGSSATATFTDGRMILSVEQSPNPAPPGGPVNVTVRVHLDALAGPTTWNSTSWTLSGPSGPVAGPVCVNSEDHSVGDGHADGEHFATFTLTAPAQPGTYAFNVLVRSDDACADFASNVRFGSLVVAAATNALPTNSAGGPYTSTEGASIDLNGAASDPDGDNLTHTWTFTPGPTVDAGASCAFSDATALNPTITCTDDGAYTLTLTTTDGQNPAVTSSATLDVGNAAPVISGVTLSPASAENRYRVGESVVVTATFTDAGVHDTHTCSSSALAFEVAPITAGPSSASGGSCSNTLTFGSEGEYDVTMTVTDDDGGSHAASVKVVVVAPDPPAGFVSGAGLLRSPAGAIANKPKVAGHATFGFLAKYHKGATTPSGFFLFSSHPGRLQFRSATLDRLTVDAAADRAQLEGRGTVNGAGGYSFLASMTNGKPDRMRLRIWKTATGAVVYDNVASGEGMGSAVIGAILIHLKQ